MAVRTGQILLTCDCDREDVDRPDHLKNKEWDHYLVQGCHPTDRIKSAGRPTDKFPS